MCLIEGVDVGALQPVCSHTQGPGAKVGDLSCELRISMPKTVYNGLHERFLRFHKGFCIGLRATSFELFN